ncbi:MAG: hypothetical protein IT359_03775 [Gemmatimonadaceae bacterium]|nr:hypothetical protein [Gemmatimonadaceae bacterium]
MADAIAQEITATQAAIILPFFGFPPSVTNGGAVVSQVLSLPLNGVLTSLPVQLQVLRAEWFSATDVAQVRDGGSPASGERALVVDFGTSRTVAAVASASVTAATIMSVRRWLGAAFDATPLSLQSGLFGGATTFASEVRSERLLVTCKASSFEAARDAMAVQLPEIPADLELRIDGGAPVWTSVGAVTAGTLPEGTPALRLAATGTANGTQRWRSVAATGTTAPASFLQELDLAEPLNALIGDSDAPHGALREVSLSLSSRIPGAIALTTPVDLHPFLQHRSRVTLGSTDAQRSVTFATEGLQEISLTLPEWAELALGASCSIVGTCDGTRVIPPTGSDAAPVDAPVQLPAGDSAALPVPLAELVLDGARSLALAITSTQGLLTLSGVRVPLIADVGGCEVRVVLLAHDAVTMAPAAPIDGGTGKPVTVEARGDGGEQWVTLPLQSPYTLKAGEIVHAALHLLRGAATMAVAVAVPYVVPADRASGEAWPAVSDFALPFRGPPVGPWELIPAAPDLATFRGRLRLVGSAPSDRPIAPVRVALGRLPGAGDGVTPTAKGVAVQLTAASESTGTLQLVALTPCTLTVRDVVLTVTARV